LAQPIYTLSESLAPNGILSGGKFTLRPSLAFSCFGSVTVRHSSSGRQPNFAAWYKEWNGTFAPHHFQQTAPPIFRGRPSRWTHAHILFLYRLGTSLAVNVLHAGGRDCNPSPDGRYYVGHTSVTVNGTTCQAWSSQSPHRHSNDNDYQFPDGSAVAAVNYCRSPWGDRYFHTGLWCYTTDPNKRWEACNVPDCGQSLSYIT